MTFTRWPYPIADGRRLRPAIASSLHASADPDRAARAVALGLLGLTGSDVAGTTFATEVTLIPGVITGGNFVLDAVALSLIPGWASSQTIMATALSLLAGTASSFIEVSEGIAILATAKTPIYLTQQLSLSSTSEHNLIANLTELASLSATEDSSFHSSASAVESVSLSDLASVVYRLIVAESFTVSASQVNLYRQIVTAVDAVIASGLAVDTQHATHIMAELLVIDDMASVAGILTAEELVTLQATLVDRAAFYNAVIDAAVLSDTLVDSARFTLQLSDSIVLSDTVLSTAAFFEYLTEGLLIGASIAIGDAVYSAWVVNPKNYAAWRYTNFGFNSMAEFNGKTYGMMDDGLYEITGKQDQGANIKAFVKTGVMNFGTSQMKRVSRAYLYLSTAGRMVMKAVVPDANGDKAVYWYEVEARNNGTRVKVGESLESVGWQFTLTNLAGADFDVSDWKVLPMMLKRRI